MKQIFFSSILGILILSGCSTPESLQGFDSETWIKDRKGCSGDRVALIDDLDAMRKELYGKKEYVVRKVFGKPDREELLERSERIYYYYLEPGAQCTVSGNTTGANSVAIRINPLAKVSEVTYRDPIKSIKPE